MSPPGPGPGPNVSGNRRSLRPFQDLRGDGGALGPCWLGVLDTPALVRTTGDPEELRALRDSCSSSASTSQYSLTGLAFCSASAPPPAAPPQPPSWVRASHAAASNPASLCSPLLPAGDPDAPVGSFFLNFDLWRLQEGRPVCPVSRCPAALAPPPFFRVFRALW